VTETGPNGTVEPAAANFAFSCTHGPGINELEPGEASYSWHIRCIDPLGEWTLISNAKTYSGSSLADGTYTLRAECRLGDIDGDPDNGEGHQAQGDWIFEILRLGDGRPTDFTNEFTSTLQDGQYPQLGDLSHCFGFYTSCKWESTTGENRLEDLAGIWVHELVHPAQRPDPFVGNYAGDPGDYHCEAPLGELGDAHSTPPSEIDITTDKEGMYTTTQEWQHRRIGHWGWITFATRVISKTVYSSPTYDGSPGPPVLHWGIVTRLSGPYEYTMSEPVG